MVTLLSFVGTGKLRDTLYYRGEDECHTPVIQEALCEFYHPDKVILFVTDGAFHANYQEVADALAGYQVTMVSIPDGKSEEEIWGIFAAVTGAVSEKEEILFDLTHGFRSLPFIALISVAYLKDIRDISLSGVMYGAFEAGVPVPAPSGEMITRAPIFDLTRFISIFDWMGGVRSFLHHADAGLLKSLTKEISDEEFRTSRSRADTQPLMGLMSPLTTYAEAVRLSRPLEVISVASRVAGRLPEATGAIARYTPALSPLLEKISEIEVYSEEDEVTSLNLSHIARQRVLIRQQMGMGLYLQAVTLGREWMVSVLIYATGEGDHWLDRKVRVEAERTLSGAELALRGESCERSRYSDWFMTNHSWEVIAGIWSSSSHLRNELAHCGMNPDSMPVQTLLNRIRVFSDALDQFYHLVSREDR